MTDTTKLLVHKFGVRSTLILEEALVSTQVPGLRAPFEGQPTSDVRVADYKSQ
jgi:hypothetical protein